MLHHGDVSRALATPFVNTDPLSILSRAGLRWNVHIIRDPLFEDEEYRAFLGSLGYQPVAPAALGKQVKAA